MKKAYLEPEVKISHFEENDIICTSTIDNGSDDGITDASLDELLN